MPDKLVQEPDVSRSDVNVRRWGYQSYIHVYLDLLDKIQFDKTIENDMLNVFRISLKKPINYQQVIIIADGINKTT